MTDVSTGQEDQRLAEELNYIERTQGIEPAARRLDELATVLPESQIIAVRDIIGKLRENEKQI